MTFNVGIDIEEVSRFENKDKTLLEKIFSKSELKKMKSCNARHLAGMFSAKEAVIKACSPFERLKFTDVEIFHKIDGSPYAVVKSEKINMKDLKISISHTKLYSIAVVILFKM